MNVYSGIAGSTLNYYPEAIVKFPGNEEGVLKLDLVPVDGWNVHRMAHGDLVGGLFVARSEGCGVETCEICVEDEYIVIHLGQVVDYGLTLDDVDRKFNETMKAYDMVELDITTGLEKD